MSQDAVPPPPPEFFSPTIINEAAIFVSGILEKARNKIPYGDLSYNLVTHSFSSKTPPAFIALSNISNDLGQDFFYFFRSANKSIWYEHNIQEVHDGIINFMSCIEECIAFVESKDISELEKYLRFVDARLPTFPYQSTLLDHNTRNSTRQNTWKSYVVEWKKVLEKWQKYLELFDVIYPNVYHAPLDVLAPIISMYPAFFWQSFWEWLNTHRGFYTQFHELLIYRIAPAFIAHNHVLQTKYCNDALQELIRDIQLRERKSHARLHERFASIMSDHMMNEALISTGMTLMPHSESLGEDTRSGMRMDGYGGPYPLYF